MAGLFVFEISQTRVAGESKIRIYHLKLNCIMIFFITIILAYFWSSRVDFPCTSLGNFSPADLGFRLRNFNTFLADVGRVFGMMFLRDKSIRFVSGTLCIGEQPAPYFLSLCGDTFCVGESVATFRGKYSPRIGVVRWFGRLHFDIRIY